MKMPKFNTSGLKNFVGQNSPAILTGMSLIGLGATVVSACKATPKAMAILDDLHEEWEENEVELSKPKKIFEEVKAVTPTYLPTVCLGASTAACIVGSYSVNTRRTAAFATAYQITKNGFEEYKDKVIEEIGEKKEKKIRDEIAKDHIEMNPVDETMMDNLIDGEQLCYDTVSGRYFYSTIDKIRRAENACNMRLVTEMFLSLNEFYDELGLTHIRAGEDLGWALDNENSIDIKFSSQLNQKNQPCLVMDYLCAPRYNYREYWK